MKVSRRSAKKTIVAFLCSSALLLGACTVEQGSATDVGDKSSAAKASEAPKVNAPKASVKDGATGVSPRDTVEVKSQDKGLKKVSMTNEDGNEVKGKLSDDKMSWSTAEELGFNRNYTITAEDKNGKKSTTKVLHH